MSPKDRLRPFFKVRSNPSIKPIVPRMTAIEKPNPRQTPKANRREDRLAKRTFNKAQEGPSEPLKTTTHSPG